uniref:PPM-type phosphatase domain-containing protein n=1 Tax=Globisporangium ultimum (strain ATCC 200006 / CBS 805.95 / DAOM BR144) TaxID=431595 RepID=K3WE08_GLOUD
MHEAYLAVQEARDNEMAFAVREKYELPSKFTCPHCHRHFATVASCEQHLHARKHNVVAHTHFCHFDAHRLKDAVMKETEESTHSLQYAPSKDSAQDNNALKLPMGMALFQGRKKYMEDFLLVHEANVDLGFELYAVSDGHLGTRAAAFVIDNLMDITARHFAALPTIAPDVDDDARMKAEREFAELVALRQTFLELQDGFLMEIVSTDANDQADFSGCTLTVVLYFREQRRLVSANVGDSRAIAIFADEDKESDPSLSVVPLSMDHWPNVDEERGRIESSGGFVSFAGLWRVVGQLAVSRSIGDQHLRQYVTAEPSVFHTKVPSDGMLVVASDGLWETMTNEDVQRFVREQKATAQKDKSPFSTKRLEDMAQDLVIEGYVRGSQDNIALILVEL